MGYYYNCTSCDKEFKDRPYFPVRVIKKDGRRVRIGNGRIDWNSPDKLKKKFKNHTCKARLEELKK